MLDDAHIHETDETHLKVFKRPLKGLQKAFKVLQKAFNKYLRLLGTPLGGSPGEPHYTIFWAPFQSITMPYVRVWALSECLLMDL